MLLEQLFLQTWYQLLISVRNILQVIIILVIIVVLVVDILEWFITVLWMSHINQCWSVARITETWQLMNWS